MSNHPSYFQVFLTFARNSIVRDLGFRANFVLQCISSISWTAMNLGFFLIIFEHTNMIGPDTGWGRYEFFVFLSTTWIINSLVQAFFMPNVQEFSELIRTGNLDFALVKPIDTQFLISFGKIEWSSAANLLMGLGLLTYSVWQLTDSPDRPLHLNPGIFLLYLLYIFLGTGLMYGVMISLAATSIWLGRNQTLYNFWFYITNFYRYPMEIYKNSPWGWSLWGTFTFVIPILVVVNVPARLLAQPLRPEPDGTWQLALFAIFATGMILIASRACFQLALRSYRSASS